MRLKTASDIVTHLNISPDTALALSDVSARYDIGISSHILNIIKDSADPAHDPVGKQYVPTEQELIVLADELDDPIGDKPHTPVAGIVHRYKDRVLFKVTNTCAVYCRYCFRKEMVGQNAEHLSMDQQANALEYIKSHPEIWEVILTGGDPLVLSSRRLEGILNALDKIDHVKTIRIHSRVPIAQPLLINDTHLSVFEKMQKSIVLVLHVNHRKEINADVQGLMKKLHRSGCSLLSQSVLLKGVNDSKSSLEELFRTLIGVHVKPYYIHHLDRAKGTHHFRVSLAQGMQIMKDLHKDLSGICLPQYVIDIPGGYGKVPINRDYVRVADNGSYIIKDPSGKEHRYVDFPVIETPDVDIQQGKIDGVR